MATIAAAKKPATATTNSGSNGGAAWRQAYAESQAAPAASANGGAATGGASTLGTSASSVSGYTALGTHNDATLSASDQALVNQYKTAYEAAKAAGNQAAMDEAHRNAEAVRANYNYSGGSDGSDYLGWGGVNTTTTPSKLPSATSQAGYVNELYDAQRKAALAALQSAYDQQMLAIDENARNIVPYYQNAANQSAAQSEMSKAAFNEFAAASGLNSGTGGQAALAQSNVQQQNQTAIETARANALAAVEAERTSVKVNYQNKIAEAIANGDLERAAALYAEAMRVDESIVDTALNQANLDYKYLVFNTEQDNYQNELALAQQKAAQSSGSVNSEPELEWGGGKINEITKDNADDDIADAAARYYEANIINGVPQNSLYLDSASLDSWLAANGYSGQAAQLFKAYLESYGATYQRG